MGIFFNSDKIKSLLEVEIDGVKQDNPDDEDTDYNADEGDDTSTDTEDNDDYTDGVDTAGDEDTEGDDDYTDGVDSAGDEGDDTSTDTEGDTDSDVDTEGEESVPGDDTSFESLKKIESELFSNLTPEQITIKNYELKQNFINLYSTIGTTLMRINDAYKSDDNIETLKFITDKLLELREMIDFNITTAYATRTYIENNIIYQQCLSTLNAISDIINSIPVPVGSEDEDKEDEQNEVDDLEDSENNTDINSVDFSDKMIENTTIYNDYL